MNERMHELLIESGLQAYYDAQEAQIKKFAELMIDEVYSFLLDPSEDDNPWHSRAAVKKYFGVEE